MLEVWAAERASRGAGLYDGRVFSLRELSPGEMTIEPRPYRHVLASIRAPELRPMLHISPVAVTGVVMCPEGLVLGRRGATVTQHPGLWDAAPSGSLDQADPQAQLLTEMSEELGLDVSAIDSIRATGLVWDTASSVHDIVYLVETRLSAESIRTAHAARGTPEYESITVVELEKVDAFLRSNATMVVPTLRVILECARLGISRWEAR